MRMTHWCGRVKQHEVDERSLGNPPCLVPSPSQDDRLAHCRPLSKRKQLTFTALRSNDPFAAITQAPGRLFPQILERNPRRKGYAGLRD